MHIYPTKALLKSLLHYFALDLGQADADWLSKPAKTSHAKIVRNNKGTDLFMDDCAVVDLLRFYSEYNFLDKIRLKGYDAQFEIDVSDSFVHKISIINHSSPASEFILKAFLRRKIYQLADFKTWQRLKRESPPILSLLNKATSKELEQNLLQLYGALSFSINTIEWLCLQDPAQRFTYQRPQLPGQRHPGLGLSHDILAITIQMSLKQGRDAVCALPDHFHNALLLRKKGFWYLNPAYQAIFDSLCGDLQSEIDCHGLSYVSWAVKYGYVKCREGSSFSWQLEEQLYPLSYKMKSIVFSDTYWRLYIKCKQHCRRYHIQTDLATDITQYSIKNVRQSSYNNGSKMTTAHVRGGSHCSLQAITSGTEATVLQQSNFV